MEEVLELTITIVWTVQRLWTHCSENSGKPRANIDDIIVLRRISKMNDPDIYWFGLPQII